MIGCRRRHSSSIQNLLKRLRRSQMGVDSREPAVHGVEIEARRAQLLPAFDLRLNPVKVMVCKINGAGDVEVGKRATRFFTIAC